ncbi:hypothetical protein C8R44DRAFT_894200 [Mycena epipterygia]|nr:hypothetical protein C8R44DRAFT_894200 [Mycena epipterygia]
MSTNGSRLAFWNVFNALCEKVLRSANRVLHNDQIDRRPPTLESLRLRQSPVAQDAPATLRSDDISSSENILPEAGVPPRREYVWRTTDPGDQSLAAVASRLAWSDLDLNGPPSIDWPRQTGEIRIDVLDMYAKK